MAGRNGARSAECGGTRHATSVCLQGRRKRTRRRQSRGQTLVIFALSLTVLLGLAGLTIDVARAYDLSARMQRAAEAGALAGVLYMPTYFNTVRPGDVDSAISRASKEIVMNGYGSALSPTASACGAGLEVQICQSSSRPNDLKVIITETLQVVLLSGLGVQPVTLSASAQAEYLPPVQLGSRQNYFGDEMECSTVNPPDPTKTNPCGDNQGGISAAGNHLQYFLASIKGPATLKEEGGAYVYCEEGPAYPKSATDLDPNASPPLYTPYNFINPWTNHKQWPDAITNHCGVPGVGGKAGNPDQQPVGFDGPATANTAHPGGYNYAVVVPPNITNASLWIYNPSFIPQDSANPLTVNGQTYGFDYFSNYPKPQAATGDGVNSWNSGHYDSPALYFTMTYSLYQTTNPYDRTNDTLLASVNYPSYDAYAADKTTHGCASPSMVYDPYWQDYQSGGTYATPGTTATVNTYNHPSNITSGGGCLDLATGTAPSWNPTAPAACFMQWCKFPQTLSGGNTYRFVVEATGYPTNVPADPASNTIGYTSNSTDGEGTHSYALKVCPSIGLANPWGCGNGASGGNPGVGVSAWNNFGAIFDAPVGTLTPDPTNPATSCVTSNGTPYTCVDLGCIPTAYAGRKLNINLFDTAAEGPDLAVAVTPPPGSGATVVYPPFVTTSTADGLTVVPGKPFNGEWLQAIATLPSSYTGNCKSGPGGTGWWQMAYTTASGTSPQDGMTAAFSLVGSPVHLVPPS
jgi:hypothetical protein